MRIVITGACGFVGSSVVEALLQRREGLSICGIDNLQRPESEINPKRPRSLGVEFVHGDIRAASDAENLPPADWVIDAAANPSVLAGVQGGASSCQLFEHNLASLVNVLALPLRTRGDAFELDVTAELSPGVSAKGIGPGFSTAPISLYGSTKLAAEAVALEFGPHVPRAGPRERQYDIPWIVMDGREQETDFDWHREMPLGAILEEIACHAERHPDWLENVGL